MKLKRKITKEDFDSAEEQLKGFYIVNPGNANEYLLDTDPDPDNAALVRAKAAEKKGPMTPLHALPNWKRKLPALTNGSTLKAATVRLWNGNTRNAKRL